MNCEEARQAREEYARGKLNKDQARGVAQHLQNCPACRGSFKDLARVQKELESIKDQPLPSGLWFDIEDTLRQKEERSWQERLWKFPRQPQLAGALAGLLLIFMVLGYQVDRYQARQEVNMYLGQVISYLQGEVSLIGDEDISLGTI